MNTLIEILDYEQTENIISPLVFDFDKVIYLYDQYHDFSMKRKTLYHLLKEKGICDVEFLLADSEDIFDQLVKKYPSAIFNLSNGSRTLLVKMTQFCEREKQRCFTLNFQRKSFLNLRGCEELQKKFNVPHLSIKNIVELSAGEIMKSVHKLPEMTDELKKNVRKIIEIMNSDSNAWTKLLSSFAKAMKDSDDNEIWIKHPDDDDQDKLLEELEDEGIIRLHKHGSKVRIEFKSEKLMDLFVDSGAWLEYQSYLECVDSKLFDEVRISTLIDWNSESQNSNDPTCEIDLIAIRNCIPVFVSCKMNKCSALDLYEIKLLSKKLGGSLGRAAIISKASALKKGEPLYLKAKELEISIIGEKEIEEGKIAEHLYQTLL